MLLEQCFQGKRDIEETLGIVQDQTSFELFEEVERRSRKPVRKGR